MKWFWYSLIGFCLFMCGCKSKNLSKSVGFDEHRVSELSYMNEKAHIDTTKTTRIEQLSERTHIIETFNIKKYDKDTGKLVEEADAKRETIQNSDTVASEEEEKGLLIAKNDSLNHFREATKTTESETKEESFGGQEAFGKWSGIAIGCIIGLLIVYLLKKLRIN